MNGYASSTDFGLKIVCVVCDKKLREPRVLSCLHTFCIDCIRSFEPYAVNSPDDGADSRSSLSSGGSSGTNRGKSVVILCPECDTEVSLPSDGIEALPSNFIAQKFLLLASLNQESAKLQCDLCADSSSAGSRCEECSIYMCGFCVQAHKRQRKTSSHTVISLEEARKKGLNNVHRPIFCRTHSNEEVQMFCENCDETVCRDCCLVEHRNHRCEFIDNVLSSKKQIIHNLLSQTKPHIDVLEVAIEGVESMQVAVTEKCDEITNDISMFIDSYIKALEKHKNNLLSKVDEMESEKHKILNLQSIQLKQMLDDFKSSCSFVTDVLEEGSGAEILSVRKLLLNRLRELNSYKYKCEPKTNSFIKFLSSENAGSVDGYKMIGHVTSTEDQQFKCIVKGEGLSSGKVGWRSEFLVLVKNGYKNYQLDVEMFSQMDRNRKIEVDIRNEKNGVHLVSYTPPSSGQYWLNVLINSTPIQGSPFSVLVQSKPKEHSGIWHCCTFCSSGGKKDVTCGCGGTMPGGFQGCGHGHPSHPGQLHWSCCGQLIKDSECSPVMTHQITAADNKVTLSPTFQSVSL